MIYSYSGQGLRHFKKIRKFFLKITMRKLLLEQAEKESDVSVLFSHWSDNTITKIKDLKNKTHPGVDDKK